MSSPDDFSFGWQDEFLAELTRRPNYMTEVRLRTFILEIHPAMMSSFTDTELTWQMMA